VLNHDDEAKKHYGPKLPGPLARLKSWLQAHHMTLMTLADTPHSIALGSAIGIFWGFTPLWTLKTLLSIGTAWVCRCNKLAAAIAVTLHDILLPLMPAIYIWEYNIGYRLIHRHGLPGRVQAADFGWWDYISWNAFVRLVWPALVGSLLLAIPSAIVVYFLMRLLLSRSRAAQKTG
jgi:uncharacterized protein (DUF2062 family)